MNLTEDNIKLIFGLKLKQLRTLKKLSQLELSEKSGLSVSYLNEIEKGKKYPKAEKISTLAAALDVSYDKLVSIKLDKQLAPVGEVLSSRLLEEVPLELFGIKKAKLIEMIANAPLKVTAFISTLSQVANTYNLTQENFYFAMLRSYQEMNENYFEDLEKAAVKFRNEFGLPSSGVIPSTDLKQILEDRFGYRVEENDFSDFPKLTHIRSVYIEEAKKILINAKMAENQKAFLYAKEIGYQFLEMSGERALMTPWPRATSFDHLLNNSRASYFAGAVLISAESLVDQLTETFSSSKWSSRRLLTVLESYNSSPEMFMIRLLNIIPKQFGLGGMFFMRYDNRKAENQTWLKKQLHLSRSQDLESVSLLREHCKNWAQNSIFENLGTSVKAHCQKFKTETGQSYTVIALSRPMKRNPNASLAVMIGFEDSSSFQRKVGFANDASISSILMKQDSEKMKSESEFLEIQEAMQQLMDKEKAAVSELTD